MIVQLLQGLVAPITALLAKRQEAKQAKVQVEGKLAQARVEGSQNIQLNDQEWEAVGQALQGGTWKDEYVTLSLVSLVNLMVVGGIAAAFGYAQVLEGVVAAIHALVAAGVDVGLLITTVVMAAVGLHIKRNL